jgi:dTDP-4-dehydrorhamnose reductase
MQRVAVLGAGGLLGSMLAWVIRASPDLEAIPVAREDFDATADDPEQLLSRLGCVWALNAIGVLRSRIDESDPASVAAATEVNAEFPHRLARAATATGVRLIHFGTDAVFDASSGPHDEGAPHLGTGVYAQSKSRGEPDASEALILRCSIVGPERGKPRSLLGWALGQPAGATIDGYTDARWNGVTSWHMAKLCAAIVSRDASPPSPLHVVPDDAVTKAELLELILAAFGRRDVTVRRVASGNPSDLTLTTSHPKVGGTLWAAAGWRRPPTIAQMLIELAEHRPDAGRRCG